MIYAIILSLIAGTLGLYYIFFKDLSLFKEHGIPHLRPLSLLGNMGPSIFRRQAITNFIQTIYNVHPNAKYSGLYDFTKLIVVLRDPELIKSIALKHFDMFSDHRSFIEEDQDPLFGKNLFSLRGNRWRQVRSLVSPTFTSSKIKNMFKLMTECGVEFGNYLAQLPSEQRIMEIKDAFMRYTNDVTATCAFGIKVDSMRNPNNEFYVCKEATSFNSTALLKIYIITCLPWLARIFNIKFIRKEIADFFQNVVETTIRTRDENDIVRPDILQLMMENRDKECKAKLNIDDMVALAFMFFFGGFNSTATLMCFAAHEIAVNQNIHERLQNKINQVLEDTKGQAPYEAVNSMEYLDAVINEALRKYPVVSTMDRVCIEDFEFEPTLPGAKPFTLRKGQGILIPVYGVHHDPQYFKELERFDPGRFVGERKKTTLNCGAYIPFGVGCA